VTFRQWLFTGTFFIIATVIGAILGHFLGPRGPGMVGRGGPSKQSPVRIVGGSMKIRGVADWSTCTGSPTNCILLGGIDTTTVSLDGQLSSGTTEETGWIGMTKNWTIQVWGRDPKNHMNQGAGSIQICPSNSSGVCGAPGAPTYVTVRTISSSGSNPFQIIPDSPDTHQGFRYYDPAWIPTDLEANYVEDIFSIQVVLGGVTHKYSCSDGACNIYIGQ